MKVAVGLSGGVDSSSAAKLLLEAGHEVTGVYMRLWGGARNGSSCSTADGAAASAAARHLGIPLVEIDHTEEFQQKVLIPFISATQRGETVNPCISCNKTFKVDRFISWAEANGFDAVATGHHARIVTDGESVHLGRSKDLKKDQSYVLYMLSAEQLKKVLLPLGDMTKDEVRTVAGIAGLPAAETPDSMDLCFDPKTVLGDAGLLTPGEIVDGDGNVLGTVAATELVTIGQRRGLNLSTGTGVRRFVTEVDRTGTSPKVVVGDLSELVTSVTRLTDVTWTKETPSGSVLAQSSAHGKVHPCTVQEDEHGATLHWEDPTRKVAPGQSIVLYDPTDHLVLGGGTATR